MSDRITVWSGSVRVEKTLESDVEGGYAVDVRVRSTYDTTLAVRVLDALPDDADPAAVSPASTSDGDVTVTDGGTVRIEGRVAPDASVHYRYTVAGAEVPGVVGAPVVDSALPVATERGGSPTPAARPVRPVVGGGMDSVASLPRTNADTGTAEEHPAVGIVATVDEAEAAVEATRRAVAADRDVFVAADRRARDVARLVGALGATVVTPPVPDASVGVLRAALVETARARSYPGIALWPPTESVPTERYAAFADGGFEVEPLDVNESTLTVTLPDRWRDRPASTVCAVPAYNEAETVGDVVRRAARHVDEVLVVDDGSRDDTAERARNAGATVVRHESNYGYGGALGTALAEADRRGDDRLVVVDGDGQHDPDDIPRLLDAQREEAADIVIGSRFADGAETSLPRYRRVGLSVVNGLTNLSMGALRPRSWVRDTQSGFRVYGRRAIRTLAADTTIGDHMDASTDIIYHAHRHDYHIAEVGTTMNYDVDNANSFNPVYHGYVLLRNLLRIIERDRPVVTLGLPGTVAVVSGAVLAYHAAYRTAAGAFVPELVVASALLLVCGGFVLAVAAVGHATNVQRSSPDAPHHPPRPRDDESPERGR
ncbi:glycosyltransferase family 2 protein [Halomarina ordinaria]|uniref:Glycosyltransferase n=1 Tax=Halomarina ordinaria TaxID=3033939 RepID=A0ABD5U5R4_9EURY|nr:glycosyltransferase family 2 protein [Halomarina sp. PSRA2]